MNAGASSAPRRIDIQVPGSLLVLPLVAASLYFFVFFGGEKPAVSAGMDDGLSAEQRRPATAGTGGPLPLVDVAQPTSGLQPLVIEEPLPPPPRAIDDSVPTPEGRPVARPGANTRTLAQRRDADAEQLAVMRERVDVTVYSTAWCPACRSLRGYLAERGIRATEYDVERNSSAQARQRQLNPRGSVPTVDIEGQVLVGFSPKSIEAAIDRAARARLERL